MALEDMVQRFKSVGAGQVISDFNAIAAAQERMGKGGAGGNQAAVDYWGKVGSAANTAAMALGGVAAAGAAAAAWVVKGAMDQEQAIAAMNIAFKGNKAAAADAYAWAKKYADITPATTPEVVATAQRMKLVTNEYQKWTELTSKLSAGMHKPLEETAQTVQKVLSGSSEGLDSLQMTYGIMRKTMKEGGWTGAMQTEEDIASVQKALETVIQARFFNAIAEQGATAAGRLSTLSGSISNLQAALGNELMPQFKIGIETVNSWVDGLSKMGPEQKARIIELGKMAVVVGGLGAGGMKLVQVYALVKGAALLRSAGNIAANTAEAASATALAAAYTEAATASKFASGGFTNLGVPGFGARNLAPIAVETGLGAKMLGGLNKALTPLTALINPITMAATAIAGFALIYEKDVRPAQKAAVAAGDKMGAMMDEVEAGRYDPLTRQTYTSMPSMEQFRSYMQEWALKDTEGMARWMTEHNIGKTWGGLGIWDYPSAYTAWRAGTQPIMRGPTRSGIPQGTEPVNEAGMYGWKDEDPYGFAEVAGFPSGWDPMTETFQGIETSGMTEKEAELVRTNMEYRKWKRAYVGKVRANQLQDIDEAQQWIEAGSKDILEKGTAWVSDATRFGGRSDPSIGEAITQAGISGTGLHQIGFQREQRSLYARSLIPEMIEQARREAAALIEANSNVPLSTLGARELNRKLARLTRATQQAIDAVAKAADQFDIDELEKAASELEREMQMQVAGAEGGISWAGMWHRAATIARNVRKQGEITSRFDPVAGAELTKKADRDEYMAQLAYENNVMDFNVKSRSAALRDLAQVRRMEELTGGKQSPAMRGLAGAGGGPMHSLALNSHYIQKSLAQVQSEEMGKWIESVSGAQTFNMPMGWMQGLTSLLPKQNMMWEPPKTIGRRDVGQTGLGTSLSLPQDLALDKELGWDDIASEATLIEEINASWLLSIRNLAKALDEAQGEVARDAAELALLTERQGYSAWLWDEKERKAKKAKPNIAREILSTGGISGLAQMELSQVVSGGYRGYRAYGTSYSPNEPGRAGLRAYSSGEKRSEITVKLGHGLVGEITRQATDQSIRLFIEGANLG